MVSIRNMKNNIININEDNDSKNIKETNEELCFIYTPDTENLKKALNPSVTFKNIDLKLEEELLNTDNKLKNSNSEIKYELSKDSIKMMMDICSLMLRHKLSSSLIIDYGENHAFSNSLRGIMNNRILKGEEILKYSGKCDLSTYVNFKLLISIVRSFSELEYVGLMKQGDYLELLGILHRFQLCIDQATNQKDADNFEKQYIKLTSPDEMGDNFKVMYFKKAGEKSVYPFIYDVLSKLI